MTLQISFSVGQKRVIIVSFRADIFIQIFYVYLTFESRTFVALHNKTCRARRQRILYMLTMSFLAKLCSQKVILSEYSDEIELNLQGNALIFLFHSLHVKIGKI